MIKTSIEQLSESIGFDIGMSDNVVQADLLNGFCKGLHNSMDKNKLERQISYMVNGLSVNSHFVIKEIAEFIKLKESES